MEKSPLSTLRLHYKPKIPPVLQDLKKVSIKKGSFPKVHEDIKKLFTHTNNQPIVEFEQGDKSFSEISLRVGVVFSGGQASGGHNVISGLFDSLREIHPDNVLIGFLNGPSGIVDNNSIEITENLLKDYRNQGGFDLLGSGRTKIETPEQLEKSLKTTQQLELDGLLIIGGDDSNTNAAVLAEYFAEKGCQAKVIGAPKTIDGDLRNEYIEMSFGFDSACKTYAELIGNICKDALSAKKYYHFIRLMGRSASHITLECALKTQPNYVLIAEEIAEKKLTLKQIVQDLASFVIERSHNQKNYGVVLLPEGLIEFIPEVKALIKELNELLAKGKEHLAHINQLSEPSEKIEYVTNHLSQESQSCFSIFPEKIKEQLLIDRDPHGNVQVSKIETEHLLVEMLKKELQQDKSFQGKFNAVTHFFGYEGRSCMPSNFDADYCYCLGYTASLLIYSGLSGYICCVSNLNKPSDSWEIKGIPIVSFMNLEKRHGKEKPVIKKYLIDTSTEACKRLVNKRSAWMIEDHYLLPGPMQFWGEKKLTDSFPISIS
ncbi:MAG: diphosphate--fructose-6-phosphate 1-phosphotransferase [Chlamydiota bacterium]